MSLRVMPWQFTPTLFLVLLTFQRNQGLNKRTDSTTTYWYDLCQIYHRPQTYRDCISNRKTTRLTCGTDMRNVWKMVSLPSLWIFFFSRNLRIQTPALVSAAGPSYLAGQSIQNEALLQTGNKNLNPLPLEN